MLSHESKPTRWFCCCILFIRHGKMASINIKFISQLYFVWYFVYRQCEVMKAISVRLMRDGTHGKMASLRLITMFINSRVYWTCFSQKVITESVVHLYRKSQGMNIIHQFCVYDTKLRIWTIANEHWSVRVEKKNMLDTNDRQLISESNSNECFIQKFFFGLKLQTHKQTNRTLFFHAPGRLSRIVQRVQNHSYQSYLTWFQRVLKVENAKPNSDPSDSFRYDFKVDFVLENHSIDSLVICIENKVEVIETDR